MTSKSLARWGLLEGMSAMVSLMKRASSTCLAWVGRSFRRVSTQRRPILWSGLSCQSRMIILAWLIILIPVRIQVSRSVTTGAEHLLATW